MVETTEQQSEKEMEEKANDDDSMSTIDKAEDMEMLWKKKILENQRKYNNEMIQQTKRKQE